MGKIIEFNPIKHDVVKIYGERRAKVIDKIKNEISKKMNFAKADVEVLSILKYSDNEFHVFGVINDLDENYFFTEYISIFITNDILPAADEIIEFESDIFARQILTSDGREYLNEK